MIQVELGCCWTIAFTNIGLGAMPFVWVCTTRDVYERRLAQLNAQPHITVIHAGPGHVKEN
jgi:hypothetical protein